MKLNVFAVYDIKAKSYANPFFLAHAGQAIRSFSDLAKDEKSSINAHPEDYQLYRCSEYNDETGLFEKLERPEFLVNASDFVIKQKGE